MDPDKNPYAPGAGTQTPELAGRNELRETVRIALERVRAGRSTKSVLLVGLRGVGKTVLLDRLRGDAMSFGGMAEWVPCALGHTFGTGRRPGQPHPGHPSICGFYLMVFGTHTELRVPAAAQRAESSAGGMAEWLKAPVLKAIQEPQ
ncbi:MAG: ATP-binding protein [Elusimicrobia bacterium]|nr:ATP-binding protein [Elusimicrobiota bacterium]MBP9699071.1 ATP-binding protein [Elusimicrobiota bacterium]